MCSDSAYLAPEFEKFLAMQWNVTNTTVADAIKVTYTFLPLPYHNQVWIAHKLLPLLLDECRFGAKCQFMDYLHYCFANQDFILGGQDKTFNQLVFSWTSMVAEALNVPQADLLAVFNDSYDTHDSEWRTREMYKWNAHHHNSGTPFGYVNGVLLENFPEKADDWMNLLFSVYQSQYRPPKQTQRADL